MCKCAAHPTLVLVLSTCQPMVPHNSHVCATAQHSTTRGRNTAKHHMLVATCAMTAWRQLMPTHRWLRLSACSAAKLLRTLQPWHEACVHAGLINCKISAHSVQDTQPPVTFVHNTCNSSSSVVCVCIRWHDLCNSKLAYISTVLIVDTMAQ